MFPATFSKQNESVWRWRVLLEHIVELGVGVAQSEVEESRRGRYTCRDAEAMGVTTRKRVEYDVWTSARTLQRTSPTC
jgi:hypothetical protein